MLPRVAGAGVYNMAYHFLMPSWLYTHKKFTPWVDILQLTLSTFVGTINDNSISNLSAYIGSCTSTRVSFRVRTHAYKNKIYKNIPLFFYVSLHIALRISNIFHTSKPLTLFEDRYFFDNNGCFYLVLRLGLVLVFVLSFEAH